MIFTKARGLDVPWIFIKHQEVIIIMQKMLQPNQIKKAIHPRSRLSSTDKWYGYGFVFPMIAGYSLFVLIPILATVVISFTDWSLLFKPNFIGFKNYTKLFTGDPVFYKTMWNTLYFLILFLPSNIIITLLLAALLKENIPGVGFFRTAVFSPVVTTVVVWSLLWKYMLQTDNGLINIFLKMIGIEGPQWLYNTRLAIPVVVVVTLTKSLGMNMVIFINAMQDVPKMYYEASTIDGAPRWKQFTKITLPLIAPSLFLVTIITIIGAMKVFGQIYTTTGGGPGDSSFVFVYYIYQQAFRFYQFGYASTISILLFLIVLALTIFQWNIRRKWVHHEQ